jgi:hypothetical protein
VAAELMNLNYWAVLAGGLMYMAFGALYFSPIMFGKTWSRLNDRQSGAQAGNPFNYVGSALAAFLSSLLIAVLIRLAGAEDVWSGLSLGLLIGMVVALAYLKNALFGLATNKAVAVAVGDHLISLTLLSLLHALWH